MCVDVCVCLEVCMCVDMCMDVNVHSVWMGISVCRCLFVNVWFEYVSGIGVLVLFFPATYPSLYNIVMCS